MPLIGLASGAVIDYAHSAMQGKGSGEQTLLRQLFAALQGGDILLADALHSTWWTVLLAQSRGVDVVMPNDGRRKVDFAEGRVFGRLDHLAWWPKPKRCPDWLDAPQWQALPAGLWVREVEVAGRVLVTTLTDPEQVSPAELNRLYNSRWMIEVDFRTLKAGMDMDVLRCKSADMIEKEIAAYLLAYNLVRWTMAKAASLAHVLPRALSFAAARRVLWAFAEHLRLHAGRRLQHVIGVMLGSIASCLLPHRPDRIEPRAKKRRPKPLPLLTIPRAIAREQIMAQQALKVAA